MPRRSKSITGYLPIPLQVGCAGIGSLFENQDWRGRCNKRGLREKAAEEGADAADDRVTGLRIFLLGLLVPLRGWFRRICGSGGRVIFCDGWRVFDGPLKD